MASLAILPRLKGLLQKGLAENPKSIQLHIGLANLYLEQKQPEKVEETLKKIIALEPDKAEHVERLASYLWHEGRKDYADTLLQVIVAKEKDNEQTLGSRLPPSISPERRGKAQQVVLDGLQQNPKSFRLRFLLQENYLARGETRKAIAILQECLTLDQDDPAFVLAQRRLAEIYYRVGNVEEAEKLVAAVLEKSPNDVDGHLLKGGILVLKGEFDLAIAEYRIVLQDRPKDIGLYTKMADAFVRNQQNSLARDMLKQGLQVDPKALELHRALARLYILEKKVQDAEAQLQKMVDLHPDDPGAKIELADFYRCQCRSEKARRDLSDGHRKSS